MVEKVITDRQKEKWKINVIVSRELQCEYKQVILYSPAAAVHNKPKL